ncbi:MAG: hypothetical protein LBK53_09630 [Heliobacteriaceae bacterium]|jgi:hypothetical protein|nr:hypothetical protein [Heliobacteriaceae bacterium]
MVVRQLMVFLLLLITSLRGACAASDEAIQSKMLNLPDCRVGLTRCNDAAGEGISGLNECRHCLESFFKCNPNLKYLITWNLYL